MGTELIHSLTHLHVTTHLGRKVTAIDGPTAVQVLLGIRPATQNPSAPPLDLRFVIDRSGSMEGSKLAAVKAALRAVVDDLQPKDRLTIITFADFHTIDLAGTQMNDRGKELARAVIAAIAADGYTCISGGFEEAITRLDTNFETRGILFTDGESTVNRGEDHKSLVRSADRARGYGLPVLIYGTGAGYNFTLLEQIAARTGYGSFLKHVMEADELRDHLRAEIGFLRGVGVRGLVVCGASPKGVTISQVTRFMPQQTEIHVDAGSGFKHNSGSLDRARGQQYLIELLLTNPTPGSLEILTLELTGINVNWNAGSFRESITLTAEFTTNSAAQSEVDPDVYKVMLMMVATRQAQSGDFDGAAATYTRAGAHATADAMRENAQAVAAGRRGRAEAGRTAHTTAGGSVSVGHTVMISKVADKVDK